MTEKVKWAIIAIAGLVVITLVLVQIKKHFKLTELQVFERKENRPDVEWLERTARMQEEENKTQ